MSVQHLVDQILATGTELWPEGDQLRYRMPKDVVNPSLLATLKQHKAEILELLLFGSTVYPLSDVQLALWLECQMAAEPFAYNISMAVRIHSTVDIVAMRQACQALVNRHPALRTTIAMGEDAPYQQAYYHRVVYFDLIDVAYSSLEEIHAKVIAAHEEPFDLEAGPLFRVLLFTRRPDDHVLLLSFHHLITDGWSTWVILDELKKLYAAVRSRQPVSLSTLKCTFADYVAWQQETLAATQDRLQAYWLEALGGPLPLLKLPTDHPRTPALTYRSAVYDFRLSNELTQVLRELARRQGVTFYTLMLAAFQVLLRHYSGQTDILVGSPTTDRARFDAGDLVGCFVSPTVMRADLSRNPPFSTFLAQVRESVHGALDHQGYSLLKLVPQLNLNRSAGHAILAQAIFGLNRLHRAEEWIYLMRPRAEDKNLRITWGELELSPFTVLQYDTTSDLSLDLFEGAAAIVGSVRYAPHLFEATTIVRLVDHFRDLLQAIVDTPNETIDTLLGHSWKNGMNESYGNDGNECG
jgi:hypothetical protein